MSSAIITRRFDEVFDLSLGRTPSRGETSYWGGRNIWASISDMSCGKHISKTKEGITDKAVADTGIPIVKKGTVIMSFKLSIGKVCIADTDLYTNEAIMAFSPKKGHVIIPDFLYYYLQAYKWDNSNEVVLGFTLNKKTISNSIISYPSSIAEQQRIVDILDQEFAKIDALKANAEKSLQNAKDLFQAALEKELELKDGWHVVQMSDYFNITSSKRVFQADWTNIGVPFYRAREIVKLSKYGFVDNDLFITQEMYDAYKKKYGVPNIGDILITGVGTLGICYLVNTDAPFYFKDGNVIWLQKQKEISSRYITYCYLSKNVQDQVHSSQGAVVGTYTIEKAKTTRVNIPPTVAIQNEIVARLDAMSENCNNLQSNYQKTLTLCDDLKQALLRKAFDGEL